jgi:hypothetical protein
MVGLQLKIPEPVENEERATDKQKDFIRGLSREVGASFPSTMLDDLGKWQASAIIEQLLGFKEELSGDKPLDTSRISGLGSARSDLGTAKTVVWIFVIAFIAIALVLLLFG